MPNDQSHDTRTTNPANRFVEDHELSVAYRAAAEPGSAVLLFEETFDDQPDFTSRQYSTDTAQHADTHTIPDNWQSIYQSKVFTPEAGYAGSHHSFEILASNADKARGGTGKSMVNWRENEDISGGGEFGSNSELFKVLDEDQDELYVEFYIAFDPNWSGDDPAQSKIFRIASWNREGGAPSAYHEIAQAFSGGNQGPIYLWQYNVSGFGLRNFQSFRGGPHGTNYDMDDSTVGDLTRSLGGQGDCSLNWTNYLVGSTYQQEDPKVPDKLNGGFLPKTGTVTHEQVFGVGGTYTKMAFYVKMNSAPGVQDGKLKQWLDDELVLETDKVTWVGATSSPMPGWNIVVLGGNDQWPEGTWTTDDQREEWYSIDDVRVYSTIPEGLTP